MPERRNKTKTRSTVKKRSTAKARQTWAAEIARDMRKIGYECSAALVRKVQAHDLESEQAPIPGNAALAANILHALAERHVE